MIRETCSCGASFEDDDALFGHKTAQEWRENHRHDEGYYTTLDMDELKRRITNLEGSGNPDTPPSAEKPDESYLHKVVTANADTVKDDGERRQVGDSLAPSQPSAYDYDEGYCDCWRCDDSCQNSTENGTVVTANADNLEDDGERRQETQVSIEDEPPAGTPVWWDGEWWCKSTSTIYPEFYYAVAGRAASRMWHEMPGAVAALTPDGVTREGKNGWLEGYKAGREEAAKAVEALPLSCAIKTVAVRAARGDDA